MGPLQFEAATFAEYDRPVPPGGVTPPSPYDPVDAMYAAGRMLCADGVDTSPSQAVWAYNHSDVYVADVLSRAAAYAATNSTTGSTMGLEALAAAVGYVGTPYVWGGSTPAGGFDCSGLVQWVFGEVGVALPRTAQSQFDAGPRVPISSLAPGDLVFFGTGPNAVDHVGIYAGGSEMVDAPHSGADVRYDRFAVVLGAAWGAERLVGATAPGGVS
jgi:cell wall-associated NlpC family hydrolase